LEHVKAHHKALAEAGIDNGKASPLLLPDYVVLQGKNDPRAAKEAARTIG
jgi:hypothetical protein